MDSKGVAHTVALPNPTDVMSDEFRLSLDALLLADPEQVEEAIEVAEDAIFELDLATSAPQKAMTSSSVPRLRVAYSEHRGQLCKNWSTPFGGQNFAGAWTLFWR